MTPEITTPEDLKGKIMAVNQPGSATYVAAVLALKEFGLTADQDVTLLTVGEDADRLAALESGQVDATLLTPPLTLRAQKAGYVELVNFAEFKLPYQYTGLATTRSYIESNRPAVIALEKAVIEAIALMKKDPEGVKEVSAKYMELDVKINADELTEGYKLISDVLELVPYPTLPGIQTIIDSLIDINPDVVNITPEQIVDTSLLDEIKASGFIDQVQK